MRPGVFGGSFDPVHLGHPIMAEQCREQARLDQVLFIPAARPPHKLNHALTSFAQRSEMLALAISGNAAFRVDELERDRPGPSFTAQTLEILRERHPGAELALIVGADSLADMPYWYEPRRIVELAELLVVGRPGWEAPPEMKLREMISLPDGVVLRLRTIECPLIEIASREIRRGVAEGRSVRYQVPRAVEAYISQHGLYAAIASSVDIPPR